MVNVRAVERALNILKSLGSSEKGLTVTEISEKVGLHSATVIRLLGTLVNEDFVTKDTKTLTYSLGETFYNLSKKTSSRDELIKNARPIMQELVEKTKETVALYVLVGMQRVCIERVEGLHPIRRYIEVGDSAPLGISSSGKLLLAHAPAKLINNVLKKKLTLRDGSVVKADSLIEELENIRNNEYSSSFAENSLDSAGISAAIKGSDGQVLAALTILGPTNRINNDSVNRYKELIIPFAERLSNKMGFLG